MRSFQLTLSIEWNNQMNDNVLNNLLYYRFSILILNTRKITQAYVKLFSCFFLVIMNEMKEANYHQRENHPGVVWYDPVPAEVTQSFHISGFHLDNYNPANHQSKLIHDFRRRKKKIPAVNDCWISLPAALGGLGNASRESLGFGKERSGRMSQAAVVEWICPRANRKVKSETRMRLGGCSGVRGFWARVIRACTSDGDFFDIRVWTAKKKLMHDYLIFFLILRNNWKILFIHFFSK